MFWWLLGLGSLAIVANATMDEIRFHWSRFFGKLFKPGTKLEKWFNPSISWQNKYLFKSKFLNFIFGSVFVWVTDFWHLLKSIIIDSIIISFFIVLPTQGWTFVDYLIVWGFIRASQGILFEVTEAFYDTIGSKLKNKINKKLKK